jgi:hypothetical protein
MKRDCRSDATKVYIISKIKTADVFRHVPNWCCRSTPVTFVSLCIHVAEMGLLPYYICLFLYPCSNSRAAEQIFMNFDVREFS